MASKKERYDFTLIMIGDAGVGKTSLLIRFADDEFKESYQPTVGVDFRYRTFVVDQKKIKLQIWDTAGQERFRTLTSNYYRGADGIVLAYDITNSKTFRHVAEWMKNVDKYGRRRAIRMVLGNKCDLEHAREVPKDLAEKYAEEHGITWIETSAKNAENVDLAFRRMALKLLENKTFEQRQAERKEKAAVLNTAAKDNRSSTKCCS
ncbi:hypothetical protein AAMO2058_000746900 [Amorphochlora amoebiformis]